MKRMIEHVALRVSNLDRSIAFHRDVLGLAPVGRRAIRGGEVEQVVFRVGEDVLVLFHSEGFVSGEVGARSGMDHLAFSFDDAEYRAVLARLRASGREPHRGEEKNLGAFGVGYATYFHDPDNVEIEIKRYDDPPEQPGAEWHESGRRMGGRPAGQ